MFQTCCSMPIFVVQNSLVMYTCACTPVGPPYDCHNIALRSVVVRATAYCAACSGSPLETDRVSSWMEAL
eukprot:10651713-Heterocapsa_arctica.AAC.1